MQCQAPPIRLLAFPGRANFAITDPGRRTNRCQPSYDKTRQQCRLQTGHQFPLGDGKHSFRKAVYTAWRDGPESRRSFSAPVLVEWGSHSGPWQTCFGLHGDAGANSLPPCELRLKNMRCGEVATIGLPNIASLAPPWTSLAAARKG